jgi:mannosyl-3-phosphoglycerate synthase
LVFLSANITTLRKRMRIESVKQIEHLGAVRIHPVRRVLELDSGTRVPSLLKESAEPQRIERELIADIQKRLAIVLPIKDEDLKVFEGVISGIPHDCLMIVVSNSQREEINNLDSVTPPRETRLLFTRKTLTWGKL